MATGRIYDASEVQRMNDLLTTQENLFKQQDSESEVANKSVLRYTVIIAGAVVVLIALKVLIKKNK